MTVNDGDGHAVGRIRFDEHGVPIIDVLREHGRPRIESLAAYLAEPRPVRPRPSCVG